MKSVETGRNSTGKKAGQVNWVGRFQKRQWISGTYESEHANDVSMEVQAILVILKFLGVSEWDLGLPGPHAGASGFL